jgi:uncharacterized membrane protein
MLIYNQTVSNLGASIMKLLTNLLSTDYGIQSVAVIAFVLGMCVFFYLFFKRKMNEDAKNAGE